MLQISVETVPVHLLFLAAAVQPFIDHSERTAVKRVYRAIVAAYSVVLEVTPQFCGEGLPPLFGFALVSYLFQPLIYLGGLGPQLFGGCFPSKFEAPFPCLVTKVSEPEKIKCMGLALLFVGIDLFITPKAESTTLFRMDVQLEAIETMPQNLFDTFRIARVLDDTHEIVCVSYYFAEARYMGFHRPFKPSVEDVV